METALLILYPLALIGPRFIMPALAFHAALLFLAGARQGRLPLVGLHDTLSFFAFCIGAVYAIAGWNRGRDLLTFLATPLVMLIVAASLVSPSPGGPMPPVLRTVWFELHVSLSFVSYALFALGAVFGLVFLYGDDPSAEDGQYRCLLLGFVLFSVAMIFGGVWAYLAWGSYWLWTPKELWTTIVWFTYGLYLHARLVRGWNGPKAAWTGIAGFAIVLFTYAGVGLLMKSSHSF
jgi:ABC-type transport system involved in cytochrome c biogenesis permease subunit